MSADEQSDRPDIDDLDQDELYLAIFEFAQDLHTRGHTRAEIVHKLREVADRTEEFWEDKDSYHMAPAEKDVVLPSDFYPGDDNGE